MTIVVLDTNALPRGHFSVAAIERVVDEVGGEAIVVVPEVVVWEWAEHARASYVAFEEAARSVHTDQLIIPRPEIAAAPPIDELVDRIQRNLPRHVQVWSPPDHVWRDAVREQVLQVGSGELKVNIKTGAADAIVLACAEAESATGDELVLLVTNDKKLSRNARSLENVRCATGYKGLLEAMYSFVPATDDLAVALGETLPDYFNVFLSEHGEAISFAEHGVAVHVSPGPWNWPADAVLTTVHLKRIDIVEVHDLEVETGERTRRGLAELRLFGDIAGTVIEQHAENLGHTSATRRVVDFSQEFVDVTVEVRWDRHWRVEEVRTTGAAVVVLVDPRISDELDDGYRFCATADS
ncbi:hypothetical protein GCM10010910_04070 [Microbacterium nanhaiense]|uniref:DUF4935 domain-containing protein n=1 Tax=Microbacterium nanhaiense TaxID=1301026 RepID=A0ABQ2MWA8_9MICO|nr:hypothetical protein [Microbacterium nanhaiense]GGO59927.1 hypothetical protein GCM10010910_04070 [Microbacterium nanhaiense]